MKANDIVRSNEYMYLTANPNLKNWRNLNSNLAYNWYHNNSFSLAVLPVMTVISTARQPSTTYTIMERLFFAAS